MRLPSWTPRDRSQVDELQRELQMATNKMLSTAARPPASIAGVRPPPTAAAPDLDLDDIFSGLSLVGDTPAAAEEPAPAPAEAAADTRAPAEESPPAAPAEQSAASAADAPAR